MMTQFPEFASMRHAARLLHIECEALALQGRFVEAANTLVTGLRMARHVDQEPLILAYLVHIAIEALAFSALRKLLYYSNGSPTVAARIRQIIEMEWRRPSLAGDQSLPGDVLRRAPLQRRVGIGRDPLPRRPAEPRPILSPGGGR